MNQRDLIRIPLMLVVLGLNALFAHHAAPPGPAHAGFQTIRAMRLGSYAVLIMATVLAAQAFLCGREQAQHHPRISMLTVFTHVYGLGLAVFVSVYCLSGVSGDATGMYFIAGTVIGCDDVIERARDAAQRRAVFVASVLFSGAALVAGSFSEEGAGEAGSAFLDGKWLVALFGALLPLLSPFSFLAVRGRRFYNPVTVYDFLHFGMPFAVFLAAQTLLFLGMLPQERGPAPPPPNASAALNATTIDRLVDYARLVSQEDVFVPLLSFSMIPTVFLAIQSTLLYSTADFLAAAAAVAAFRALARGMAQPPLIVVFVSAAVGFSLRVYACFRDEGDACSVPYAKETEDALAEGEVLRKLQEDIEVADV